MYCYYQSSTFTNHFANYIEATVLGRKVLGPDMQTKLLQQGCSEQPADMDEPCDLRDGA